MTMRCQWDSGQITTKETGSPVSVLMERVERMLLAEMIWWRHWRRLTWSWSELSITRQVQWMSLSVTWSWRLQFHQTLASVKPRMWSSVCVLQATLASPVNSVPQDTSDSLGESVGDQWPRVLQATTVTPAPASSVRCVRVLWPRPATSLVASVTWTQTDRWPVSVLQDTRAGGVGSARLDTRAILSPSEDPVPKVSYLSPYQLSTFTTFPVSHVWALNSDVVVTIF